MSAQQRLSCWTKCAIPRCSCRLERIFCFKQWRQGLLHWSATHRQLPTCSLTPAQQTRQLLTFQRRGLQTGWQTTSLLSSHAGYSGDTISRCQVGHVQKYSLTCRQLRQIDYCPGLKKEKEGKKLKSRSRCHWLNGLNPIGSLHSGVAPLPASTEANKYINKYIAAWRWANWPWFSPQVWKSSFSAWP